MKNIKYLFILFTFSLCSELNSQNIKEYYFEISNPINIPNLITNNGKVSLIFSNNLLTNIFRNFIVTDFKSAFPNTNTPFLKTIYIIKCDKRLINEIQINYSMYFGRIEEITPIQELYIPNDLVGSSGNSWMNQSYLNFIRSPEAWDISKGDNVKIGIGEQVNIQQEDLVGKTINVYGGDPSPTSVTHGTKVAVIAGGNTDNNGIGIASAGFNVTIKSGGGWLALRPIADAGARVINLSWGNCSNLPLTSQIGQSTINELWDLGVIVVAAAGNGLASCSTSATYYHYPASLDRVFSVTSVGHRSPYYSTTDGNREDVFENFNITGYPNITTPAFTMTYNDKVDLSAPGYNIITPTSNNSYIDTVWGTSYAAPLVTGTIGLMFGANSCLFPEEIESILKLTAYKNDILQLNLPYQGLIGAGRLDAFLAVDMAKDMALPNGTVEVKDRIIDRWDFVLKTSPYEIKMTNNIVSNNASLDFTAKNNIEILSGDYNPNIASSGYIDLKIKEVNTACNPAANSPQSRFSSTKIISTVKNPYVTAKLYPSPNNGSFNLILDQNFSDGYDIVIYDFLGKSVYKINSKESILNINIPSIPTGLYFVKVSSSAINETLKFIKN